MLGHLPDYSMVLFLDYSCGEVVNWYPNGPFCCVVVRNSRFGGIDYTHGIYAGFGKSCR